MSARTAFIGAILGALIGGLGSLGGAYLSNDSARQERVFQQRQTSYAQFYTAVDVLLYETSAARDAIAAQDEAGYGAAVKASRAAFRVSRTAGFTAYLSSDDPDVVNDLSAATGFAFRLPPFAEADLEALEADVERLDAALGSFTGKARAEAEG